MLNNKFSLNVSSKFFCVFILESKIVPQKIDRKKHHLDLQLKFKKQAAEAFLPIRIKTNPVLSVYEVFFLMLASFNGLYSYHHTFTCFAMRTSIINNTHFI